MGSHLSSLGIKCTNEESYTKVLEEILTKVGYSEFVDRKTGKGYLQTGFTNQIELDFIVQGGEITDLELHHNTNHYVNLDTFKYYEEDKCLCSIGFGDYVLNVKVPNTFYIVPENDKKKYMCQISCINETYELFDTVEEFAKKKYDGQIAEESIFPYGTFENNSGCIINGYIKDIEVLTNPFHNDKYLKVYLQSCDNIFECFFDYDEYNKLKVGKLMSGTFYLTGKIMERYYGSEMGNTKRKEQKESKIQTLDDLFDALWNSWSRETAYPTCQNEWVPMDRCYGQCAITASLVYDIFGGEIHKIKNRDGSTHYYNIIEGRVVDLTGYQFDLFGIKAQYEKNPIIVQREYCNKNLDTKARYDKLVQNVAQYLKK